MIRRQRRRHRRWMLVLAVVLPVTFVAGIALRPERPVASPGMPWNEPPIDPAEVARTTRAVDFEGESRLTLGGPVPAPEGRGARLGLRLEGELAESEILVYTSGRPAAWEGGWREEARLIGVLRAGRPIVARLTDSEAAGGGSLRLVDLARDRELPAVDLVPPAGGGG